MPLQVNLCYLKGVELDLKRRKIAVLMGGWSREREVSLKSGENVYQALKRLGYRAVKVDLAAPEELIPELAGVEVAFICLHGGLGEDGTLQALLDLLRIPYTGSPALACRLAMDKLLAKEAFERAGLPTPPYLRYEPSPRWPKLAREGLGLPLVLKPIGEGSSLGVQIIRKEEELEEALRRAREQLGEGFFAERYIPGKEVTAGVLRIDGEDRALPLIELRPRREFYDYQAKYTPGETEFIIPAELDERVTLKVQELALEAHRALGCFGFSRVDLRVTEAGGVHILEVNTIPGMTQTSDLPKAAQAAGISFEELVEYMLQTAQEKQEEGKEKGREGKGRKGGEEGCPRSRGGR